MSKVIKHSLNSVDMVARLFNHINNPLVSFRNIILSGSFTFISIHRSPTTVTLIQPASTWMHWATRKLVLYFHLLRFHSPLLNISTLLLQALPKLTFPMVSRYFLD